MFNMRCDTTAVGALILHPSFRRIDWVREMAKSQAEKFLQKHSEAYLLLDMPASDAREILEKDLKRLLRQQQSNGCWTRGDEGRRKSCDLLKVFCRLGMLETLLSKKQIRYDPFAPFREEEDVYGIVVRRDVLKSPATMDFLLEENLRSDIELKQKPDGSWNETVIGTTNSIQALLNLGATIESASLRAAAKYLLEQSVKNVKQLGPNCGEAEIAHDMFTSEERAAEFATAESENPEWNPKQVCYQHLPMIQTGAAVRALIRLGFANDTRVVAACQNLVEIKLKYGGWCKSNVQSAIKAEKREQRADEKSR